MTIRSRLATFVIVIFNVFVFGTSNAGAQNDPVFDATGFQQNRDYVSQEPFEHIDALTGSLVLTFTDLVLPGNAGRDLRFQRTYNSKGKFPSPWTFGIAGVVMRVVDPGLPPLPLDPPESAQSPKLITTDGGKEGTTWLNQPVGSDLTSYRWVVSRRFLRYDRTDRVLYSPDGTIAHYDAQGRVIDSTDTFGNVVSFEWTPGWLHVTQSLGAGQERVVVLEMDDTSFLPARMTFSDRDWTYLYDESAIGPLMKVATAPEGLESTFDYDASTAELIHLKIPTGGEITYGYGTREFERAASRGGLAHSVSRVVLNRLRHGRATVAGEWTYEYSGNSSQRVTVVVGPPGPTQTRTTYVHESVVTDGTRSVSDTLGGGLAVKTVTTEALESDTVLQSEQQTYRILPVAAWSEQTEGTLEPRLRTVSRHSRDYTTEYTYRDAEFSDYHRPYLITETGENSATSRTTTRAFDYNFNSAANGLPYFVGKMGVETVTENGKSVTKAWGYNHATGFLQAEVNYGITTAFSPDAQGNVAAVTKANGKTTSSTYEWGVVKEIWTPKYTVTRVINPNGTVAEETQAGRTTKFFYDDLLRIRETRPAGGTNSIWTSYDPAGAWVRVDRGDAFTTTTLDGFGRPVGTVNSVDVRTRTAYDAEGRKTYESYPFVGAPQSATDIGTSIFYDGLGRITSRRHPDGKESTIAYGSGTVTFTDENTPSRTTVHTRTAFGNPDDARLTTVTDADGKTWEYKYNALGTLTEVAGPPDPDGEPIVRKWMYSDPAKPTLLQREEQPESGVTTYTEYDAAGVLKKRKDAKGVEFIYEYDGNDRVWLITGGGQTTSVTYEAGSDNRETLSVGNLMTRFGYDAAGRLQSRTDTIDGQGYVRLFGYDGNDNLRQITYPSGRVVTYDVDTASRITKVRDVTGGRDVASSFTYHPSGGVSAFTSGNGIVNQANFDSHRYWPLAISAGPWQLSYNNYDGVGNVRTIGDTRQGMGQSFVYDKLDRLTTATGPYGSATYTYDAHGNRNGGYTYWPGTLRLKTMPTGESFGYDNNGNMTSSPNATFSYTPNNMLETSTVSGVTATYKYDADGWRAQKTSGGSVVYFLRGLNGELLTEFIEPGTSGQKVRDYIYAGSRLLAVITVP